LRTLREPVRILEQAADRGRKRSGVPRRHEQPGLAVDDVFRDPADWSRDDRDAGGLRLDHGEAKTLVERGEREDVERSEQIGNVDAFSEELEAVAERPGELLQLRTQ